MTGCMSSAFPAAPAWASSLVSVGVTGTNGKTTTTTFVAALLGLLAKPVARVTTLGCFLDDARLDVPKHYPGFLETLRRAHQAGGRYAALEMTSEALSLGFARAWPCRFGAFTNLSLDHSDAHGSPEHYLASKAQLFMSLPPDGAAVLNGCDANAALLRDVLPSGVEEVRYGVESRGTTWDALHLSAHAANVTLEGTSAELKGSARFPGMPAELRLRAVGEIYLENALAALSVALLAGVPAPRALALLADVPAPPGRFQVVHRGPDVVVDYAHTPDALERTLATARRVCRGELTLVFGAGGDRDRAKRPLLGAAARAADRVVLTSDNPRGEPPERIADEIAAGLMPHAEVRRELDRERAIRDAVQSASERDLVLIAGKGHESTQEVAGVELPLSDVAVVLQSAKYPR
ncbi:MAG: UDP-N-acetylmuramyl-tripeptide synthetase [Myxococcales bacterium]|nr:MAG: UDP-N-acetylmuramyl-tripeptide synthetase [Myxococcales bacterium]